MLKFIPALARKVTVPGSSASPLNPTNGPRVDPDPNVFINTVEGYFSILKHGIYGGVCQHVSEAHLKRYRCEFDLRYNNRDALKVDDQA